MGRDKLSALPSEKIDAVIVGSGAAGSHFAARLAQDGKRVAILEAGPARPKDDLVSSMLWARRLKGGGAPVLETGKGTVGNGFNVGRGVGGSTMHHYAVWPRLHENDFRVKSLYGRSRDWPIAYADLQPYYDRVQEECGISGDHLAETTRPPGAAYPMPPVPVSEQGRVVAQGFAAKGMKVSPIPLAVTSRSYKGRPPCIWDGWCDAGCPIGALANAQTIHLPQAEAAGATIHPDTEVVRVLTSADGKRVTGVEAMTKDGERVRVMADVVVVAAFTIQSPRLLLASATPQHPEGLANSSGTLGRFVTSHGAAPIFGLHPKATTPAFGAFGGQLLNQEHYDDKNAHASSGAFGSYQWMIANALKPNGLLGIAPTRPDLRGPALTKFMEQATEHIITMTGVTEDEALAENRITLSPRKDALGVPLASVDYTPSKASLALWDAAIAEGLEVFRAAGTSEAWNAPRAPMHIMGGTVMGASADDSVTNSYGQTHDLPNLFVGGAGLFPTSGGVNPTFTVHALAARSSEYLVKNWDSVIG